MQLLKNPKILVVTPDRATARTLEESLKTEILGGWALTGAESLLEAEDALQRWNFDMALLDLDQPGFGGLGGLDRLRQIVPSLPVVAMLSSEQAGLDSQAIIAGASTTIYRGAMNRPSLLSAARSVLDKGQHYGQEKDFFIERLGHALKASRIERNQVAAIILSVDGLAASKGMLGIEEELLLQRRLGQSIQKCLRAGDVMAHLEGPVFGILVPRLRCAEDLLPLVTRLQNLLLGMNFEGGIPGASLGVALSPGDSQESLGLYSRAMVAMKQARLHGGACAQFYNRELQHRLSRDMRMDVELRLGLIRGEFTLDYGPIAGKFREAILGWDHPTWGALGFSSFMTAAENCGQIRGLGEWVINSACRDMAAHPDFKVLLKLSPRQFSGPGLLSAFRKATQAHGVDPSRFSVEVTEPCAPRDMDYAMAILDEFNDLGMEVTMNDFADAA